MMVSHVASTERVKRKQQQKRRRLRLPVEERGTDMTVKKKAPPRGAAYNPNRNRKPTKIEAAELARLKRLKAKRAKK